MPNELYSFGSWIRLRRQSLLLTREQLAQRVGCAEVTIRKIESDERKPSAQVATLLAQHLAVPTEIQELFVRAARGMLPVDQLPAAQAVTLVAVPSPSDVSPSPRPSSNLPAPVHTLIGRNQELTDLGRLLHGPLRLLTLTGAGGTGKTSLALQVLRDIREQYRHGIWFIDLSAVTEAEQIAPLIAQVLSIPEAPDRPIRDGLLHWLRDRHILLLLDNCEQVLADVASLVADMLRQAGMLRILATSRIPLRISAEQEYPVTPLALPDMSSMLDMETLSHYAAVALFLARARGVRPDFVLTEANAATIADLCVRLDGLPLAIELAAARIRLFSPEQLLNRLIADRIQTLVGGARDVPLRQQTMAATVAWSYRLLNSEQQCLLMRLGVFVGGWTLEAAEAVCGQALDVVTTLEALVEHSLVQRLETTAGPRYRMLETIREYAFGQLRESGELAALQQSHAVYFVALAEQAEPKLRSREQMLWLGRLDLENANLGAVLTWAHSSSTNQKQQHTLGCRLANALWLFWLIRNKIHDARSWLQADWDTIPMQVQARTLVVRELTIGWFEGIRSYRRWLTDEGLAYIRSYGDQNTLVMALADLTFFKTHLIPDRALTYADQNRSLALSVQDPWLQAYAQLGYGAANYFANGHSETGLQQLRDGVNLIRQTQERWLTICAAWTMGIALLECGDYAGAKHEFSTNLPLCDQISLHIGRTYALWGLAIVAMNEGDIQQAYKYQKAHVEAEMAVGNIASGFFSNFEASECALVLGNFELTRHHLDKAEQALTINIEPSHHRYPPSQFDLVKVRSASVWLEIQQCQLEKARLAYLKMLQVIRTIETSDWGRNEIYQDRTEQLCVPEHMCSAWLAYIRGDIVVAEQQCEIVRQIEVKNIDALVCMARISILKQQYFQALHYITDAVESVKHEWTNKWQSICLLLEQAEIFQHVPDHIQAINILKSCFPMFRKAHALIHIIRSLEICANLWALESYTVQSARLWGAAEALREQIGAPMWPVDRPEYARRVAAARSQCKSEEWEAAWAAGRALRWEEAADQALQWVDSRA